MDLRSLLARSGLVKSTYETSRQKLSEAYRRGHQYTGTGENPIFEPKIGCDRDYRFDDSGLFDSGGSFIPHPDAANPVLTRDDIDDCWARFVADPFVVYDGSTYHMFFEIKSMGGHVFIGHAYSDDGVEYTYNRIVIQPEIAQHTYPHVFHWDESWIMVPSPGSNVAGECRIYESTDFPTDWELRSIPIEDQVRLDPTPILYEGTWYFIYQEIGNYDIAMAYADTLDGPWHTHPKSPIFLIDVDVVEACQIGNAEMVPAGRPLYCDDGIHVYYRSHSATEVYHYRITELSRDTFEQERADPNPAFANRRVEEWNERFIHTVNPVYPWHESDPIVAVDGLEADRYCWSIGIYTLEKG